MKNKNFFDRSIMDQVTKIFDDTIKTDHKVITEEAAKSILKKYKISVPTSSLVNSSRQAAKDAKKLGFPLVMKVVSPQILHKTDAVSYTHLTLPTKA